MENRIIHSFRQRMKNYGYTDIHVKLISPYPLSKYLVTALEPDEKTIFSCEYEFVDMHNAFRKQGRHYHGYDYSFF